MKTRGRGCAKGMKKWGTGAKLHVMFDNNFQPLGEEGTLLKGQLGTIVRNPHRVPLTYLDWDAVPEDIKSTIWKEIEGLDLGFHLQIMADRNLTNRGFCGPVHRTGRTPFYQIRHEMSALGENTDKMSVFAKTRDENDPDVQSVLEQFTEHLADIPESLQTTEVRDKIFHEVLGEDGHGYCKTFGAGVPRSAVYGQYSSSSHASSSSIANEITRQVPNVPSRQPIIRESVGDDYTQDGEQVAFTLPTLSPRLDGQIVVSATGLCFLGPGLLCCPFMLSIWVVVYWVMLTLLAVLFYYEY
ncbi:hypothetical protein Vadar_001364 [Vaccinium darrowii]|uniref:Uncharacterized protein n=1 Tax=Vaccinium darrowii TaxID=229202 RepID=A0ACB7YJK9_9ERIC|nr:hypothetical protein Vadar_001364 [Vaccinium darrowii]